MPHQNPNPSPINPILQGAPNPIEGLIPQLAQVPDTPTGGGGVFADLFGAGQGQDLPTDVRSQLGQSALGAAGQSLLESSGPGPNGFTPGTLQAIGRALGAGQSQFLENTEAAQAAAQAKGTQERRQRLAESLNNATTPEERIAAIDSSMGEFIAAGDNDTVDALQTMREALEGPDAKFTTKSLGDGQYITTDNNTGSVVTGGTKLQDNYEPVEQIGVPEGMPLGSPRQIGWITDPLRPWDVQWTGALADAPSAAGGAGGGAGDLKEAQIKALIASSEIRPAVEGYVKLFNDVDLDAPFNADDFKVGPGIITQAGLQSKFPWVAPVTRIFTGARQEAFALNSELGKEAVGRISSGAAINQGEIATFRSMLPLPGEDPRLTYVKLRWMRNFNRTLERIIGDDNFQSTGNEAMDRELRALALRQTDIWEEAGEAFGDSLFLDSSQALEGGVSRTGGTPSTGGNRFSGVRRGQP